MTQSTIGRTITEERALDWEEEAMSQVVFGNVETKDRICAVPKTENALLLNDCEDGADELIEVQSQGSSWTIWQCREKFGEDWRPLWQSHLDRFLKLLIIEIRRRKQLYWTKETHGLARLGTVTGPLLSVLFHWGTGRVSCSQNVGTDTWKHHTNQSHCDYFPLPRDIWI